MVFALPHIGSEMPDGSLDMKIYDQWPNTALEPTPTVMDDFGFILISEFCELAARRRGSALDR